MTVNIKPTAPEVIMNSNIPSGVGVYSSYATRSIKVEHIRNISEFAAKLHKNLTLVVHISHSITSYYMNTSSYSSNLLGC